MKRAEKKRLAQGPIKANTLNFILLNIWILFFPTPNNFGLFFFIKEVMCEYRNELKEWAISVFQGPGGVFFGGRAKTPGNWVLSHIWQDCFVSPAVCLHSDHSSGIRLECLHFPH